MSIHFERRPSCHFFAPLPSDVDNLTAWQVPSYVSSHDAELFFLHLVICIKNAPRTVQPASTFILHFSDCGRKQGYLLPVFVDTWQLVHRHAQTSPSNDNIGSNDPLHDGWAPRPQVDPPLNGKMALSTPLPQAGWILPRAHACDDAASEVARASCLSMARC